MFEMEGLEPVEAKSLDRFASQKLVFYTSFNTEAMIGEEKIPLKRTRAILDAAQKSTPVVFGGVLVGFVTPQSVHVLCDFDKITNEEVKNLLIRKFQKIGSPPELINEEEIIRWFDSIGVPDEERLRLEELNRQIKEIEEVVDLEVPDAGLFKEGNPVVDWFKQSKEIGGIDYVRFEDGTVIKPDFEFNQFDELCRLRSLALDGLSRRTDQFRDEDGAAIIAGFNEEVDKILKIIEDKGNKSPEEVLLRSRALCTKVWVEDGRYLNLAIAGCLMKHSENGRYFFLGPFKAQLRVERDRLKCNVLPDGGKVKNGYAHPHFDGSGAPCLGNLQDMYAEAQKEKSVLEVMAVIGILLRSYNHASAYRDLIHWDAV